MKQITYYHILGVSIDATDDEIIAAFRAKVKQWHPDVCCHPGAEERMREINRAAEVLCDPERRRRYDLALAGQAPFEKEPKQKYTPYSGNRNFNDRLSAAGAWLRSPFRVRSRRETFRFMVAGCALFFILMILLALVFMTLSLLTVIFSSSGRAPIATDGITTTISSSLFPDADEGSGKEIPVLGEYNDPLAAHDTMITRAPEISERDLRSSRGRALQVLGLFPEPEHSFEPVKASPDNSFALAQRGYALIAPDDARKTVSSSDQILNQTTDVTWIRDDQRFVLESLDQVNIARGAYDISGPFSKRSGSLLFKNVVISSAYIVRF